MTSTPLVKSEGRSACARMIDGAVSTRSHAIPSPVGAQHAVPAAAHPTNPALQPTPTIFFVRAAASCDRGRVILASRRFDSVRGVSPPNPLPAFRSAGVPAGSVDFLVSGPPLQSSHHSN